MSDMTNRINAKMESDLKEAVAGLMASFNAPYEEQAQYLCTNERFVKAAQDANPENYHIEIGYKRQDAIKTAIATAIESNSKRTSRSQKTFTGSESPDGLPFGW